MRKINTLTFNNQNYVLVFDYEATSSDGQLSVTQYNYDLYEGGSKLDYSITLFNKMDWEEGDKTLGLMIYHHKNKDLSYHNDNLDSLEITFERMIEIINVVREHQSE